VHDVGLAMGIPMVILALLALIGGFDGVPGHDALGALLAPVIGNSVGLAAGSGLFWLSLGLGLLAALLGIAIAWARYGRGQRRSFAPSPNPLYQLLARKYFIDEIYDWVLVRPILWLGRATTTALEGLTLDGGGRGLGKVTGRVSGGLRALQTGYVRNYALGILLGAVVILVYFLAVGRL
jgi:NADH-quinone oxidoreductase subunit L